MFFFLSKILDVFLSPLTWAMLLAAGAFVPRRPRWTRWAPLASLVVLCVFSNAYTANALEGYLERAAVRSIRPGVTYDAVLLLGGVVSHGATETWNEPAYNDNVERLTVTFNLLRSGRARSVIISGGRRDAADPVVEAVVLGKQLEEWGIERSRIVLEPNARNTRENAVDSKRLAEQQHLRTLLMVTSARHMLRALQSFRAVGLDVDTLPVDYRYSDPKRVPMSLLPRAEDLDASASALREIFGGWVYRIGFR